ncbi:MAG: glyoxylase-like metal-dependent hydrolase (beta-lactamase superfamily II) [Saprospiraceae bacterium]|jgi:glyoxylase-like metal-dependent hydrolase (beta-lactamase superfamily II)
MIHTIDLHFQGIEHAIAAFLVETSVGPVIIETGPHSTFPYLKKGIENLGYSLSDIKHVFLSHIHFDHAGAAWAFAELGATIYVHPIGAPHLADPSRLWNSAKRIYQDQMEVLWGQMQPIEEDQLRITEHGEAINIGDTIFTGWHTPGHAIHHIAWQLGDHLFAGDVAGVKIGNGLVVPPCPPPDINMENWMASIELIRGLAIKNIHLTHYGKIDRIQEHLDSLEVCLKDWADWIQPYAIAKDDVADITPKFQAYVARQLSDYGISESGIQQYETANPSWMSVAGLMRYWSKRSGT